MNIGSEDVANFLEEFKPLIYKVLQKLNIQQRHMDYEDFFQELQIQLLKISKSFKSDTSDSEIERYKFLAYADRGLYWYGLNLLRQQQPHHSFETVDEESIDRLALKNDLTAGVAEPNLYTQEFFDLAKKRLSAKEYSLLLQFAKGKYTMQELADEQGVSRDTVYQWKYKIQERLQDIKECLKD